MSALTRFDALLDVLAQVWRRLTRWLTKPRHRSGTLPPVYQTREGVLVDRVARVPLRSSKADAKRLALEFARHKWADPAMTWGQARKRIKRLERELREQGADLGEMAVSVEESE